MISDTLKLCRKWWKTWNTLPVLTWVKAASAYRDGNFNLAETCYLAGLEKNPDHPARFCARLDLAYCLFRNQKLSEAENQLIYVTTHVPDSREAHLRLARLQLWTGHSLEAAWTMRRALRVLPLDAELVAIFLFAVLDNGGPSYLIHEVSGLLGELTKQQSKEPKLLVAKAQYMIQYGDYNEGKDLLVELATQLDAPFEAVMLLAELWLREGDLDRAKRYLRRALQAAPDYPRVLSLYADFYLQSSTYYNPQFGKQLAQSACQYSNWLSPRELHVLAQAYFHCGDNTTALVVASKAKQVGSKLLGAYRDSKNLEQFIQSLSEGSRA